MAKVEPCRHRPLGLWSVLCGVVMLLLGSMPSHADSYEYDELGNLKTLSSPRGTRTYTYDEVDRLDTEAGFTGSRDHAYDLNGNRTTDSASAPGTPTTASYTSNTNRIVTINGAAVSLDAAGQITNDGLNSYTWDDAGRLKTVSRAGQLRATYHYDHKHRRTRKVSTAAAPQGAKTIVYHYDDRDRLMAETSDTGVPIRSYAWADENLISQVEYAPNATSTGYDIARILYFELDQLGTPRQARERVGTIVWRWESDGYGTSAANEDPDGNGQPTTVNLRFPGQYYDEESGLHYNWHRYYVPRLGRYLSSDPIGLDGGRNTYAYANNAPTTYKDSSGELPSAVAGALAGAAFDIGIQLVGNGMRPKCIKWDVVAIAALTGAVNPFSGLSAANSALKAERQFARAAGLRDGTRAATRTAQRGDRHNSKAWKEAASWVGVEATAEGVGSLIPDERHIRIGDSCECR